MTRTDTHLDAMLRHLGAAYYESLHGRAARSDVARALDTVEEHLGEQGPPVPKSLLENWLPPGGTHRDVPGRSGVSLTEMQGGPW